MGLGIKVKRILPGLQTQTPTGSKRESVKNIPAIARGSLIYFRREKQRRIEIWGNDDVGPPYGQLRRRKKKNSALLLSSTVVLCSVRMGSPNRFPPPTSTDISCPR